MRVRLAELVAALSLGIDLGFGQPMEHVLRQCLIAPRVPEHDMRSVGGAAATMKLRTPSRSARAAACLTSTRFDATPISTLARAPDRSSPVHRGRPSVGAVRTYSARPVIPRWYSVSMSLASATTRPSHGCGRRWSVPFIQRIGIVSSGPSRWRCSSSNPSMRRISSLASSGTRAPLP